MDVHLTPELEKIIRNKLESGEYNSASDVVREALHLMKQRDEIRQAPRAENDVRNSLSRAVQGEEFLVRLLEFQILSPQHRSRMRSCSAVQHIFVAFDSGLKGDKF
jgi:antitoxin ParD1/3/4